MSAVASTLQDNYLQQLFNKQLRPIGDLLLLLPPLPTHSDGKRFTSTYESITRPSSEPPEKIEIRVLIARGKTCKAVFYSDGSADCNLVNPTVGDWENPIRDKNDLHGVSASVVIARLKDLARAAGQEHINGIQAAMETL